VLPSSGRMPVRVGPPLPNLPDNLGVYANGQSGLVFNQSPERLCGFESRHPCQTFTLAVAQPGRAPRCDRGGDGFKSRRPTHFETRGVSQAGLRRATLYRVSAGSNPARPAKFYGAVAERLGTGMSIQTTRVRVSLAPPYHTRCKLNRHEHPPLKRGAAGSSPARRITFGV
jgi:hypothetical protein